MSLVYLWLFIKSLPPYPPHPPPPTPNAHFACQMLSLAHRMSNAVLGTVLSVCLRMSDAVPLTVLSICRRMSDAVLGTQDVKYHPWHIGCQMLSLAHRMLNAVLGTLLAFHLHIACQMLSLAHRMSDAVLDTAFCFTVLIQEYNATRTWYIETVWCSWKCFQRLLSL